MSPRANFPSRAGKAPKKRKFKLADLLPKLIAKGDVRVLDVGETFEKETAAVFRRHSELRFIGVIGVVVFAIGCLLAGLFLVRSPASPPKSIIPPPSPVLPVDEATKPEEVLPSTGEVFEEIYRTEIAEAKELLDSWTGAPSKVSDAFSLAWEEDKAVPFFRSLQPEHRIFTSSSDFMGSYLDSSERLHFLYFTKSNINPEGSVSELLRLEQGRFELNWQLFVQNHYRILNTYHTSRSAAREAFYLTVKLRHSFKDDRRPQGIRTVPVSISGTNPNVWVNGWVAKSSTAIALVDIVNWNEERPVRAFLRWRPVNADPAERFLFVDEVIATDWNGAIPLL